MNEIILKLRDKDDKAAYEYSKLLGAESAQSDKYLPMIPQFADMLEDKSSYVRARGFILICNQARWAKDGQIADVFDRMRVLLYDSKPTVVRQCLLALHEVVLYRSEMAEMITDAVDKIDVLKYKESMSQLIKKDIDELMKVLG